MSHYCSFCQMWHTSASCHHPAFPHEGHYEAASSSPVRTSAFHAEDSGSNPDTATKHPTSTTERVQQEMDDKERKLALATRYWGVYTWDSLFRCVEKWVKRAETAEAECARLRAELKRLGHHSNKCAGWLPGGSRDGREMVEEKCDCGLRAALAPPVAQLDFLVSVNQALHAVGSPWRIDRHVSGQAIAVPVPECLSAALAPPVAQEGQPQ